MSSPKSDSVILKKRDISFLVGLFESRLMTISHAAALFYGGKEEYTKKRLQKLKTAGFVRDRRKRVNEPSVLVLTGKAFDLLKKLGQLQDFPALSRTSFAARANVSELTLLHELAVMDVKAALHSALTKSTAYSIEEFGTWPLIHQFETPRQGYCADVLVKPDGFIHIHEKEEGTKGYSHYFYLEVDRSSEKLDTLVSRAGCYLDFYRTGGFAVRNGGIRSDFKEYPFRVLIVLESAERRNNTAERLIQNNPPILTQTWLTTLPEVTSDPLGAIWLQPADYRNAAKGTPFENATPKYEFAYRRRPERELFIESSVQKRHLLEE